MRVPIRLILHVSKPYPSIIITAQVAPQWLSTRLQPALTLGKPGLISARSSIINSLPTVSSLSNIAAFLMSPTITWHISIKSLPLIG